VGGKLTVVPAKGGGTEVRFEAPVHWAAV
jgi:hypothetical protein